MKRIHLSALGWVEDAPIGNRLRWYYPVDFVEDKQYLGVPQTIIVQRALINLDLKDSLGTVADEDGLVPPIVPESWWRRDYFEILPSFLLKRYRLKGSVQAVRFLYMGSAKEIRLVARDSEGRIIADRMIIKEQMVTLQAPDISTLEFFSSNVVLKEIETLNLFKNRKELKWKEIARIGVKKTISLALSQAVTRYSAKTTLEQSEWNDLCEVIEEASVSNPASDDATPEEPTSWEQFQMCMGIRWEYAVLLGHGYIDGPRSQKWPGIDEIHKHLILEEVPSLPVAYRVYEERLGYSNVIVCPPSSAAPLETPAPPKYENPEVRLTYERGSDELKFVATYNLRWDQPDPFVLGVNVVEEISPSNIVKSDKGDGSKYVCRTRQPDDLPGQGFVARSRDVSFHDVKLRCRIMYMDGWDRMSEVSKYTEWTPLTLRHDPAPPNLASAMWSEGNATLTLQDNPSWIPDPVVEKDNNACIFVYRRKIGEEGLPAVDEITVSEPFPESDNLYRAITAGSENLEIFIGGYIIVGSFKAMIREVSDNKIYFMIAQGDNFFSAGPAQLHQHPLDLRLWEKVAEVSVEDLLKKSLKKLKFVDNADGPGEIADVLSYHTRVSYLGTRIGPPGNTVQALRLPAPPVKSPPFEVSLLGVDFYERTLVKIHLTPSEADDVTNGKYTIWWANGDFSADTIKDFTSKAVQGLMREQAPDKDNNLFDVLSIPVPQNGKQRTVTIGVQRVTEGGSQSGFMIRSTEIFS